MPCLPVGQVRMSARCGWCSGTTARPGSLAPGGAGRAGRWPMSRRCRPLLVSTESIQGHRPQAGTWAWHLLADLALFITLSWTPGFRTPSLQVADNMCRSLPAARQPLGNQQMVLQSTQSLVISLILSYSYRCQPVAQTPWHAISGINSAPKPGTRRRARIRTTRGSTHPPEQVPILGSWLLACSWIRFAICDF